MGHQRLSFTDAQQEYRIVLFAGRAGARRPRHSGHHSQSARGRRDSGNAFLQASEMSIYPEEFRYTKEHEWVKPEGDISVIGITDHAQHELGDIVYVDLPKVGAR